MKLLETTSGLVILAQATTFQLPHALPTNEKSNKELIERLADKGLNCPTITKIQMETVDARGVIYRISCALPRLSLNWDIRMVEPPHIEKTYFEPW